ncbi:hypothetical protein AX17_004034 [Amanita inopinata Kibby_2008]|nr:hypothetical protein AX17_004034 [Amanita inopinata Kibby_2008]
MALQDTATFWIQNVNTGQFLVSNGLNNHLVFEQTKSEGERQLWKFLSRKTPRGDTQYVIQNVGILGGYIHWNSGNNSAVTLSATQYQFHVSKSLLVQEFIVTISGSAGYESYLFYTGDSYARVMSQPGSAVEWRLIEKRTRPPTPPLPIPGLLFKVRDLLPASETYRIRSVYNSKYLLTMSDHGRVYITSQMQGENNLKRQTWSVKRDATTGLYTIQNLHTVNNSNQFLAAGLEAPGSSLVGKADPTKWTLQGINQGAHFFIGLPQENGSLSIGFSDYEAEEYDEVALVSTDGIPSQLWYFETAKHVGRDQIHAQHLLPDGKYVIRSSQTNQYMLAKRDVSGRLSGTDTSGDATVFTLRHKVDAPHIFTLHWQRDSDTKEYVINEAGKIRVSDEAGPLSDEAQWIVLPHKSSGVRVVYYVCHPAREHPVQAISARQVGREKEFVLEHMVKGHTMHQWDFISRD